MVPSKEENKLSGSENFFWSRYIWFFETAPCRISALTKTDEITMDLMLAGLWAIGQNQRRDAEANVVYAAMGAGVGITEATAMVNEFRAEKDEDSDSVGWGAVKNSITPAGW